MPRSAPPGDLRAPDSGLTGRTRLQLFQTDPTRQALAITVGFVLLRIVTSPFVGLGVDESYTVAISREFSLSYFDHPPLHQWVVWAMGEFGRSGRDLRAPFIALSGATSWLMFLLTRRMFDAAAAVWATLAFNLAGFFTAVAGLFILPDGPLNFWLLAAALALVSVIFPRIRQSAAQRWRGWLCLGFCLGLAGLSKYQAVFFGLGIAAFFLTTRGRWRELIDPAPPVAALLALAIVSPVIVWNAKHGWVSFLFQGGRGGIHHGPQPTQVLIAILGQMALMLPWIYAPLLKAAVNAACRGPTDEPRWLCLALGAPAILVFTLTPLWGEKALPHWSMSGWLMIFPLLGAWFSTISKRSGWPRAWAWMSAGATVGLWMLAASEAGTGWAKVAFPTLRSDPTVETVSWTGLGPIVRQEQARSQRCLFVAALNWRDGGKIGTAIGDLAPVRILSADPRGFGFLTRPPSLQGCDAVIVGSPAAIQNQSGELQRYFAALGPLKIDHEGRGGRDEIELQVILGKRLLAPLPPAYSPS
jgi:4-amino-4-deoxy-L-arabinose transferase-like glycosyltransferase